MTTKTKKENHFNERSMLVSLNISYWSAKKYDRKISQEVADVHDADLNVGRYRKNLLPIEAPTYHAILTAKGEARRNHYENTLPWTDEGARILLATNYMAYSETMRKLRTEFDAAVRAFVGEYPTLYAQAKTRLKSMWKADDYPTTAGIADRFGMSVKVLPLPDGADFRVDLADKDATAIRDQITQDTKDAIAEAMKDPYKRLYKVVAHMADRLGDPKAKVYDSVIGNIDEIIDLLPKLNLTNDETLLRYGEEIRTTLTKTDPEELRESPKTRKKIAKEAERISADLSAFMGGAV